MRLSFNILFTNEKMAQFVFWSHSMPPLRSKLLTSLTQMCNRPLDLEIDELMTRGDKEARLKDRSEQPSDQDETRRSYLMHAFQDLISHNFLAWHLTRASGVIRGSEDVS